jgi:hypothetical protein
VAAIKEELVDNCIETPKSAEIRLERSLVKKKGTRDERELNNAQSSQNIASSLLFIFDRNSSGSQLVPKIMKNKYLILHPRIPLPKYSRT